MQNGKRTISYFNDVNVIENDVCTPINCSICKPYSGVTHSGCKTRKNRGTQWDWCICEDFI